MKEVELKQVLGFKELFTIAVGNIIGAGVMTLMGAAISLTGRSVPLAFLIATLIVVGYALPYVFICSTARVKGGTYTMIGMLAGKKLTGVQCTMNILGNLGLGMYGLALASYIISLLGFGNQKLIAVLALTFVYILNVLGIDKMAKAQNLIVILLSVALGLFAAFGLIRIQPNYLAQDFMPNGWLGLFQAGALMTNAVAGASMITALSAEAKHPTRDIPIIIIGSTLAVAVLYALISIVAAGVLPVSQVAGKNLSVVAKVILPHPLFLFFMVCGAMFAILSTLNGQFASACRPALQACRDGWFPAFMGYVHPQFRTPVVLLTMYYLISVLTIVSGFKIRTLANLSIICTGITILITCLGVLRLPKVCPTGWAHSKFHCSMTVLKAIAFYSTIAEIFNIYMNITQLSTPILIGNIAAIIASFLFAQWRYPSTHITPSYVENIEIE
ncbi:amino acid permease [uncultured Acidaminococcus sp.]|uniref:APC family permease n=1 Tax=uncultured Acidaminococcus sp. TaxID=352152 RepID=UPI0026247C79|nr:amino acid permease [uncultured Acidaminococcus sp.]